MELHGADCSSIVLRCRAGDEKTDVNECLVSALGQSISMQASVDPFGMLPSSHPLSGANGEHLERLLDIEKRLQSVPENKAKTPFDRWEEIPDAAAQRNQLDKPKNA